MTDTAFLQMANRAEGTLAATISDIATSLTLQAGEGAEFPSTFPFRITSSDEIMEVNARAGDVLSGMTRGEEGTSPAAHLSGDKVRLHVTAGAMTQIHDSVNALEALDVILHSAGQFTGGEITKPGDPDIDIAAGTGQIRVSDSSTADLVRISWAALNAQTIPINTTRYVGVEFVSGSTGQVVIRTTENWNLTSEFPLGEVVNEGDTLHVSCVPWRVGDAIRFLVERLHGTDHIQRDNLVGGLIFGEAGVRGVTLSAGKLWVGMTPFDIVALNTDTGDDFDTYSSAGLEASAATQWPNAQYDDGGVLTNLDPNKWANLWWWVELDGELVMVYGTAQYAIEAQAEAEGVPTVLPDRLEGHALISGRFIFQEGAGSVSQILSAFDTVFSTAGVTDHDNLTNITAAQHHSNEAAFEFFLDGGGTTLTTGIKMWLQAPFAGTITAQRTLADQTGSIVLDIWNDTFANYPPTVADTITAAAKPTIVAGIKDEDETLTGWTVAFAKGDVLYVNIDSITDIQKCLLVLEVTKT